MKEIGLYIVPFLGMAGSLAIWNFSGGGGYGNAVVIIAGLCAFVALALYSSRKAAVERVSADRRSLLTILKRVEIFMRRGIRFDKAVETAISGAGEDSVIDAFSRVIRFMEMGLSYNEAVAALRGNRRDRITIVLLGIGRKDSGLPDRASVSAELYRLEHEHRLLMERKAGETVRYTTAYMVGGTVVPSLALLGFVGYSVLSFSVDAALALICSVLIFVPCALAVLGFKIRGVSYGS